MKSLLKMVIVINILSALLGNAVYSADDTTAIVKTSSPSIVKVLCENDRMNYSSAGVAIDRNLVVSSTLVTRYPCEKLVIRTRDGKNYQARIIGKDEDFQIILLSINEKVLNPISRAKNATVGEDALLMGVFLEKFPVFKGIVSSISEDEMLVNAPLLPGSHGGAVINKKGELIGIIVNAVSTAMDPEYIYSESSGKVQISAKTRRESLCLTIPTEKVMDVVDELKKFGKVRHGWLGVSVNLGNKGVFVTNVEKNSPAQKADLRPFDELLKINGKPIQHPNDLMYIVRSLKPDQKIKVDFRRGTDKKTTVALLGESRSVMPPPSLEEYLEIPQLPEMVDMNNFDINDLNMNKFMVPSTGPRTIGVNILDLSPDMAKQLNIKEGKGLMIVKVRANSPAAKAGLLVSDVLIKAGNKPMVTMSDLKNALKELKDNEPMTIEFYRNGKPGKIKVVPEKTVDVNEIYSKVIDTVKKLKTMNPQEAEKIARELERAKEVAKKSRTSATKAISQEEKKYKQEIEKLQKEKLMMQKKMEEMKKQLEEELRKKEKEEQNKGKTNQ